MYRLFYNHPALKDVLIIVIDPEARVLKSETRYNVVALYGENDKLVGYNIFHIDDVMKIKANGVIFVPDAKLLEVINSLLEREGLAPLPEIKDSGYRVAKVLSTEEHPLDEKALILKLQCGDKTYETVSSLKGIKEGSMVVVALDGTILYDGNIYHRAVIKNINNDVKVLSPVELRLEGSEKDAFLLDEDPSFKDGEDFFVR
jgi:tRNA-binding EMAP/Myf-like protein